MPWLLRILCSRLRPDSMLHKALSTYARSAEGFDEAHADWGKLVYVRLKDAGIDYPARSIVTQRQGCLYILDNFNGGISTLDWTPACTALLQRDFHHLFESRIGRYKTWALHRTILVTVIPSMSNHTELSFRGKVSHLLNEPR